MKLKTNTIQKAVVTNSKSEMLILRRSNTDTRRPLQWDLPGGMLDEGEDPIKGMEREIHEETGLMVFGTKVIYAKTEHRVWDGGEESVTFIFYSSKTVNNDVQLSYEHDEFMWLPIEDAISKFKYSLHREFLEYLVERQLEL